jgi:hypothetical protein
VKVNYTVSDGHKGRPAFGAVILLRGAGPDWTDPVTNGNAFVIHAEHGKCYTHDRQAGSQQHNGHESRFIF